MGNVTMRVKKNQVCCRCNRSGLCKSCSCSKLGRLCQNCMPSRLGRCRNSSVVPPSLNSNASTSQPSSRVLPSASSLAVTVDSASKPVTSSASLASTTADTSILSLPHNTPTANTTFAGQPLSRVPSANSLVATVDFNLEASDVFR